MREGYESYAGSQEERYSMIQSEHDAYETNAYIDIFVLVSMVCILLTQVCLVLFARLTTALFARRLRWLANCAYEPNHMGV